MNKYEINVIESTYILMWNRDTSLPYIPLSILQMKIPPHYHGFLKLFFAEEKISISDYILFICLFIFFQSSNIMLVMLNMAGIYSNLFINILQLQTFFESFLLPLESFECLPQAIRTNQFESEYIYYNIL